MDKQAKYILHELDSSFLILEQRRAESNLFCAGMLSLKNHAAAHILREIERQEMDWGVKFSGITTDNAANVVKAMSDGGYLNVRCTSHVLNLIVKNALQDASESVQNVVK